jgi:hypothetical protein
MGNGFDIPALSQGRSQRGYYGATTAAAVAKYQTSIGIPATGLFGALTRAALNGSCTTTTPVPPVPICPAGYTCVYTPGTPAQGNCPAGYICTPTTPVPPVPVPSPVPTTGATVTVNGQPTLTLTYDSAQKESALTATFNVTVNGGTTGINIYKIGGGAQFIDQKGVSYSANSISFAKLTPQNPVIGIGTDNYGQTFFIVPAGHNMGFQAVVTADPRQLFAGTYHSSLISIWANPSKDINNSFNLQVPANNTNSKTIIGEVSPYISSINPSIVSAGQTITLSGQRLSVRDAISIDNNSVRLDVGGGQTSLSFIVPSLTNGYHSIQVTDAVTGASNQVSFQFQSATTTPVSGTQIIASLDPASPLSSTVQISTSAQTNNVPLAVFDVKSQGGASTLQSLQFGINVTLPYVLNQGLASALFSSVSIRANGQTYYGTFGGVGKDGIASFNNFSIPLPANVNVPITLYGNVNQSTNSSLDGSTASASLLLNSIVAIDQNYNTVPVSPSQGFVNGNTITFSSTGVQVSNTSATLGTSGICNVTSNVCSQPATFTFSITAGNSPIYLANPNPLSSSCPVGFVCSSPITIDSSAVIRVTAISANPSTFGGDGSTYYMIAPGATRQFTVNIVISNNQLPAGAYTVKVTAINYGTDTNNLSSNSITSGLQNLQVTVSFNGGTTQQPTITSISPTSGPVGSQITIDGSNFQAGSVVKISGPGLNNFAMIPNSVSATQIIGYMPSQATYSGVYAIYVSYADVTSNTVQFTVQSTPTSQPPVISGGTFPTSLTVGQTGTWTVNASDPQNGSLSYSVNWGDATTCPAGYTCVTPAIGASVFTQSSSFTHSYSSAGTYTITFTVNNVAGLSAQTTSTVQVGNAVTPPPTPVCPVGYTCYVPGGTTPICPVGYTCTTVTDNCPTGYVCTISTINPPTSIPVCPVGYTCIPGTPTNPQPVNCPSGYVCTVNQPVSTTSTIPATATYACPNSRYTLNTTTNMCKNNSAFGGTTQPTTIYSCPSGYTLNSSTKTCTKTVSVVTQYDLTATIWDAVNQYLNSQH